MFRNSRIQDFRKERGLSVRQLARLVAVDERTVRYWESGRYAPQKRYVRRLAQALGVEVEDLQMTPERERQVWQEREASLTELADRVSISNLEETNDVPGGDESPDRRHHVELPARRDA